MFSLYQGGFALETHTIIRKFEPLDLKKVLIIEEKSFLYPWTKVQFLFFSKRNPNEFLVACKNKKVVGYAISEIIRKQGHLLNLAIDPKHRCQGIGKKLMEYIIIHLHKKGATTFWLEVRNSNKTARDFYLTLGFKERELKLNYYKNEDALIMEKKIKN